MEIATRTAAVNLVSLLVTGRRLDATERARIRGSLRLSGFRGTLRHAVLGMLAGGQSRQAETIVVAPALDGALRLALAADDSGVSLEILANGTYEPQLVAFYRRTLRPGMTVLDAGANIGFHALHAALLVGPEGRVVAVEPDPRNVSLIRASLALAGVPLRVEVIEAALSDTDGTVVLSDLGNHANSGARFTHTDRGVLQRLVHGPAPMFCEVRSFRWDEGRLDTRIDLVKIDVEGYEPFVLRGMEGSLARHRPIVVAEFAPGNLRDIGGVEPAAFLASMRDRGYSASVLEEDGRETPAGSPDAIFSRLGARHHLDLVYSPTGSR